MASRWMSTNRNGSAPPWRIFSIIAAPRWMMPWWREEANRARDAALHNMVQIYLCGLSISSQAKLIAQLSLRYAASAWCLNRDSEDMPEHYEETIKHPLWLAFRSGATMPIGECQMRNILTG